MGRLVWWFFFWVGGHWRQEENLKFQEESKSESAQPSSLSRYQSTTTKHESDPFISFHFLSFLFILLHFIFHFSFFSFSLKRAR